MSAKPKLNLNINIETLNKDIQEHAEKEKGFIPTSIANSMIDSAKK
jgi:hypothetical protein